METGKRRLVSVRRRIPEARRAAYARAWGELHRAATARGAHAWHFVSADAPEVYLEFLEFGPDRDPREDAAVRSALLALRTDFGEPRPPEEWVELRSPTVENP